jgi:hypothetical protein
LDVQIGCAVNSLLHFNADWMCSEIRRISVPRDTTLHAVADLHAFLICFLAAVHDIESAHPISTFNVHPVY